MNFFGWRKAGVAQRVLILIITLTVVLFAAFYLIGYSHPFEENPDFIEPKLTPVLLGFMGVIFLLAIGVTVWAMVSSIRKHRKGGIATTNKVPAAAIAISVVVVTAVVLILSFVLGSSEAISVNGEQFETTSWLKAADMFVVTSLLLMVVATTAVAISAIITHFKHK